MNIYERSSVQNVEDLVSLGSMLEAQETEVAVHESSD
jgi:hypothetical protein